MSLPLRSITPLASRAQCIQVCRQCLRKSYATAPPAPPLLLKLRGDLKSALKEKDTNRLNVLRGVLADITNASKGSSPLKTDMQILVLLRKRAAAAKAAAQDFDSHGRQDLKEKEDAQALVLEEYAGGVETLSEAEITNTIKTVRDELLGTGEKVDKGVLLKKLLGPEGALVGKNVENKMVAGYVQDVLGGKS